MVEKVWKEILQNDPDKEFLLEGICDGFRVVSGDREELDEIDTETEQFIHNPKFAPALDAQLRLELSQDKYRISNLVLKNVSPIFAIPKSNGSVRIIQDCNKPVGRSINDHSSTDYKVKYQTVNDAVESLTPGCFMSKIDLKAAYRSVPIHPKDFWFTGIKHTFIGDKKPTYLYNTRLIQGAKLSPMIFHRLSQAVKRYCQTIGINTVVYLDDFLVIADNYKDALSVQHRVIHILRRLGFDIAWEKIEGPKQRITFLGVELDSKEMSMGLPSEKVVGFISMLHDFKQRKRASRKQLEKLCGKLSWAASVVRAGRSYLRRAFDMLAPLRKSKHKAICTPDFYRDIDWWITVMKNKPWKHILFKKPVNTIYIDACNSGSGFLFNGDWGYVNWQCDFPHLRRAHINVKETISAIFAVWRWWPYLRDSQVLFITDSTTARANIFKGTSRNPEVMPWLRLLHMLSAIHNFDIYSSHLAGEFMPADDVSRLHNYGHLRNFMSSYGICDQVACAKFMHEIPLHTSAASALLIYKQVIGGDKLNAILTTVS